MIHFWKHTSIVRAQAASSCLHTISQAIHSYYTLVTSKHKYCCFDSMDSRYKTQFQITTQNSLQA